ncbi:MAG: hypothetical protein P1U50_04690 [Parvibaculaceae bacterium]|nr:hypothetical protein [Parvibaculaceae bacterium]
MTDRSRGNWWPYFANGSFVIIGGLLLANGVFMMAAPEEWFWSIPGVASTGDYNPHLVKDVGFTYGLLALALFAALRVRSARHILLSIVSLWLVAHAILHLVDVATGCLPPENLVIDSPGVFFPAVFMCVMTWLDFRWSRVAWTND